MEKLDCICKLQFNEWVSYECDAYAILEHCHEWHTCAFEVPWQIATEVPTIVLCVRQRGGGHSAENKLFKPQQRLNIYFIGGTIKENYDEALRSLVTLTLDSIKKLFVVERCWASQMTERRTKWVVLRVWRYVDRQAAKVSENCSTVQVPPFSSNTWFFYVFKIWQHERAYSQCSHRFVS